MLFQMAGWRRFLYLSEMGLFLVSLFIAWCAFSICFVGWKLVVPPLPWYVRKWQLRNQPLSDPRERDVWAFRLSIAAVWASLFGMWALVSGGRADFGLGGAVSSAAWLLFLALAGRLQIVSEKAMHAEINGDISARFADNAGWIRNAEDLAFRWRKAKEKFDELDAQRMEWGLEREDAIELYKRSEVELYLRVRLPYERGLEPPVPISPPSVSGPRTAIAI